MNLTIKSVYPKMDCFSIGLSKIKIIRTNAKLVCSLLLVDVIVAAPGKII